MTCWGPPRAVRDGIRRENALMRAWPNTADYALVDEIPPRSIYSLEVFVTF
jgi:hypothetical protein